MTPRFVILTTVVALLAIGCVAPQASDEEVVSNRGECCEPEFYVFMKPKEQVGAIGSVRISESKGKILIITDTERVLQAHDEYTALKRLILESPEWSANTGEQYSRMPWSGPPRDILDVSQKDRGIRLQGDRVPPDWRKRILTLAQ
jgi:hypothetical protein